MSSSAPPAGPLFTDSLTATGPGPSGNGNPFAGATGFGFAIPQGDPASIAADAASVRDAAVRLAAQQSALTVASQVALETDGGWKGSAASAFADYSNHVVTRSRANAEALTGAALALEQLARALQEAQSITRRAEADCEHAQAESTKQQQLAADAGQAAATAEASSGAAVHPAEQQHYARQAQAARQDQQTAAGAAAAARSALEAATHTGIAADQRYQAEAQMLAARLSSSASSLQAPQSLSGGAPVPVSVTGSDAEVAAVIAAAGKTGKGLSQLLSDPEKVRALACGIAVTPGTMLQLVKDSEQEELAQAVAAAKARHGSDGLFSVVEHQTGQVLSGAGSVFAGFGSAIEHPWRTAQSLLNTQPAYRELFDGENPMQASTAARQSTDQLASSAIDLSDFEHGHIARGIGELGANVLVGVGSDGVADGLRAGGAARATSAETLAQLGGYAHVPHLGDAAGVIGKLAGMNRVDITIATQASVNSVQGLIERTAGVDTQTVQQLSQRLQTQTDPRVVYATPPPSHLTTAPKYVPQVPRPHGAPRGS